MTQAVSRIYKALGVISGTSMDGIDVALVETDGERHVQPGAGATYPYPADLRAQLLAVIADPVRARNDALGALERAVTQAHAEAIAQFLANHAIAPATLDVIGVHGQTILHRPAERFTRQLGDGRAVARRFGVTTVSRFRDADVAAGGEGAPLVPLYHQAIAAAQPQPLMVLNLGGVGNVTYLDGGTVIAFDTGPANALVDDFVRRRCGKAFDAGGALAASGHVDGEIVARFSAHPFFDRPPPKSLDRNAFHDVLQAVESLSDADGAATLAACTVAATAHALRHVPRPPLRWLVAGGGRRNAFMMERLRAAMGSRIEPIETIGFDGDFLEAQCFGFLAVRSLRALPLTLPTTTGVPCPLTGGVIALPG